MTSTSVITGQSIGTGSNVGEGLFAIALTPQTITDRFFIEGIITNNAAGQTLLNSRVVIRYACYNANITPATAVPILVQNNRYVEITPKTGGGAIYSRTSLLEPLSGPYLYVWVDCPNLTLAATLTVFVHEGP